MSRIIGKEIPVLDKGFVRVVDTMGDDSAIVQAARVSYGSGTKTKRGDRGLIRYLMRHWHTSPFEMCEIKLHVKLPMFVARQWIRHRTANVNEYSARYSVLDKEFYIPNGFAPQSPDNKQGAAGGFVRNSNALLDSYRIETERDFDLYEELLQSDVAREQARMHLPVSTYTQWYWKVDLHNLFHFLYLRADLHAQAEIRAYADAIWEMVQEWVPDAAEAFEDYRLEGVHLSKMDRQFIEELIYLYDVDLTQVPVPDKMTEREHKELLEKFTNTGD